MPISPPTVAPTAASFSLGPSYLGYCNYKARNGLPLGKKNIRRTAQFRIHLLLVENTVDKTTYKAPYVCIANQTPRVAKKFRKLWIY